MERELRDIVWQAIDMLAEEQGLTRDEVIVSALRDYCVPRGIWNPDWDDKLAAKAYDTNL